jgi:hypothetical protein
MTKLFASAEKRIRLGDVDNTADVSTVSDSPNVVTAGEVAAAASVFPSTIMASATSSPKITVSPATWTGTATMTNPKPAEPVHRGAPERVLMPTKITRKVLIAFLDEETDEPVWAARLEATDVDMFLGAPGDPDAGPELKVSLSLEKRFEQ